MEEYTSIIKRVISKDSLFNEAADIAKANSTGGKIWVVGSFLYKNILKEKYGLDNLKIGDYDFILENQRDYSNTWAPHDWTIKTTLFGGPRFFRGDSQIDIYPISDTCHNIAPKEFMGNTAEEKIKTYIQNVLFDIQSMAYDLGEEKLYDAGSIKAMQKKEMRVIRLNDCIEIAKRKNISLEDYSDSKASPMDLKPIYPTLKT